LDRGHDGRFGPFRLDLRNERLWRGADELVLRPKTFAVLSHLVKHAGDLALKDELLQAVWPGVAVSEAVLTVCIGEIRQALGDDSHAPRYVETMHRRGYRFIAPVAWSRGHERPAAAPAASRRAGPDPGSLVGREGELSRLERCLDAAQRGERGVAFVTGEAGIGKSTLVDAFLDRVPLGAGLWCARGQCIARHGPGEAYLPMLDALGRLCREFGSASLKACLSRWAPSWLLQMPALVDTADELAALRRRTVDTGQPRMLRELAEALEALTVERPLILVLEDLHWSDYATLDLIAWLAQRQEPARLLVLGTYRPVEVIVRDHPLQAVKQELMRRGRCVELPLELLTLAQVGQHLAARFGAAAASRAPLQELARTVHRRTDGHPLFLVALLDALVRDGWLEERAGGWEVRAGIEAAAQEVPRTLQELVEQQFQQLGAEEQRLLEAASVVGLEGSAAAVAAGLSEDVTVTEERCAVLARRGQFLRDSGNEEWPDGTVVGRYRFRHTLYRQVVYDRIPVGRRVQLHARIGERQEAGYGAQAAEHAAELAIHFEQGRTPGRALHYRRQAAENAARRHAYEETLGHLRRGLALLPRVPEGPERDRHEMELHLALGQASTALYGPAAAAVGEAYTRAHELSQRLGDAAPHLAALHGLRRHHLGRAQVERARELGEEALEVARRLPDPAVQRAHVALGTCLLYLGEPTAARAHLLHGIVDETPEAPRTGGLPLELDAGILWRTSAGIASWLLGHPDEAVAHTEAALARVRTLGVPFLEVNVLCHATAISQFLRDVPMARQRAEAAMRLATESGFSMWTAHATILQGWVLAMEGDAAEGVQRIVRGLQTWRTTGQQLGQPYFLALLAEAHGLARQAEAGLGVVSEALTFVETHGLRLWECELYRLKGELLSLVPTAPRREAEGFLERAIDVARGQGARSLELRAALSLSRLGRRLGRKEPARRLVKEIYTSFTEGFDTADLREARALVNGT
jgi:DNA-binding winged helix-turn-helix (wHTH) protein/tetratricopeptide (TPR) repeat protein